MGAGLWAGMPPSALTPAHTGGDRAPPGGVRGGHHLRHTHIFKRLFHVWKRRKQTFLPDRPQRAKLNPEDGVTLSPSAWVWMDTWVWERIVRRGQGLQDLSAGLAKSGREGHSERPWGRGRRLVTSENWACQFRAKVTDRKRMGLVRQGCGSDT